MPKSNKEKFKETHIALNVVITEIIDTVKRIENATKTAPSYIPELKSKLQTLKEVRNKYLKQNREINLKLKKEDKIEEIKKMLRKGGFKEDNYGNWKKVEKDGDEIRIKFNKLSIRKEGKLKSKGMKTWYNQGSSYYKDIVITPYDVRTNSDISQWGKFGSKGNPRLISARELKED